MPATATAAAVVATMATAVVPDYTPTLWKIQHMEVQWHLLDDYQVALSGKSVIIMGLTSVLSPQKGEATLGATWGSSEDIKEPRAMIQKDTFHSQDTAGGHDPDSAVVYDLPHVNSSYRTAGAASSHYETASTAGAVYHSYELPNIDTSAHYEVDTSDLALAEPSARQYEVPVSPYDQPTPKVYYSTA